MINNVDLTIGLPVYNEEDKINEVLEDIFSQEYKKFKLIISDNASDDKTYEICEKWLKKEKNIELIKQEKKLNINENFYFIYSKVNTKYFMWIAADDKRSKDYIKKNVEFLNNNQNYTASSSENSIEMSNKDIKKVSFSIDGSKSQRYTKFLENCFYSHGIFYSIFRYTDLTGTEKYLNYMAWDWIVNLTILKNGNFKRIKEGSFFSSYGGTSTKKEYIYSNKINKIDKILPFFKFMVVYFNFYLNGEFNFRNFLYSIIIFLKIHLNYIKKYIRNNK